MLWNEQSLLLTDDGLRVEIWSNYGVWGGPVGDLRVFGGVPSEAQGWWCKLRVLPVFLSASWLSLWLSLHTHSNTASLPQTPGSRSCLILNWELQTVRENNSSSLLSAPLSLFS